MIVPISTTLQKSYRDTLSIPSAPSMLDTDEKIIPVAVVAQTSDVSTATNVKITDGTDTLGINTDGTISDFMTYLLINGTLILRDGNRTSTGTTTLYTVTAGKTLYLTACGCNGSASGAYISTDADASTRTLCRVNIGSLTDEATACMSYAIPIKIPATKVVNFTSAGTSSQGGWMAGYEI